MSLVTSRYLCIHMPRYIAIDFGLKRTGLAHTDENGTIASPLETIDSRELEKVMKDYILRHSPEAIILGLPRDLKGGDTNITQNVRLLQKRLTHLFPLQEIILVDERFTSGMAMQAMITAGASKKQRGVKGNVDKVSAAIILQSYLDSKSWKT